jgi:hypothetical protein
MASVGLVAALLCVASPARAGVTATGDAALAQSLVLRKSDLTSGFAATTLGTASQASAASDAVASCRSTSRSRTGNYGVLLINRAEGVEVLSIADVYPTVAVARAQALSDAAFFRCMRQSGSGHTMRRTVNGLQQSITFRTVSLPILARRSADWIGVLDLGLLIDNGGQKYKASQQWIHARYGRVILRTLVSSGGVSHSELSGLTGILDERARTAKTR